MVSCFSKNAISCRNSGSGILSHNDVQGNLQPSRSDLRKVVMLDASEKPTPPHLSVLPSPFQSRSWVLPGIQPVSSENSGYLFESKRRSAEASKQNHAKGNRVYKFLDFAATFVDNMYFFFAGSTILNSQLHGISYFPVQYVECRSRLAPVPPCRPATACLQPYGSSSHCRWSCLGEILKTSALTESLILPSGWERNMPMSNS